MRFILLGCGGFVGRNLLQRLLAEPGVSVFGVDRNAERVARFLGDRRFDFVEGDVYAPEVWSRVAGELDRADAVVNLAAVCQPAKYITHPMETLRSNALDVLPLVDLCTEKGAWLVHFSTSEIYGQSIRSKLPEGTGHDIPDGTLHIDEFDEHTSPLLMGPVRSPRWTYASAKQFLERYIAARAQQDGLAATIIRPFNFVGPEMDDVRRPGSTDIPRVYACFASALIYGEPLKLVNGGGQRRVATAIEDAVEALWLILTNPERSRHETYNIGNRAMEITIHDLAHRMRAVYAGITGDADAAETPIVPVSGEAFYGRGYQDCDRRMPRVDRLEALGWAPTMGWDEVLPGLLRHYIERAKILGVPLQGTAAE